MNAITRTTLALVFAALTLAAADYKPTDAERARWTMHDMNSWRICFAAYKQDHGSYPEAKSAADVKAMFEPVYVAHLPMTDAWGNPYDVTSSATAFRVVSAGSDGKLDRDSWSTGGDVASFAGDAAVTQEGRWLFRHWAMK